MRDLLPFLSIAPRRKRTATGSRFPSLVPRLSPRFAAIFIALQLSVLSPEMLRVLVPNTPGCHSQCPMHRKRLRCHETQPAGGLLESRCPHHANPGVALRTPGCSCGAPHIDGMPARSLALLPVAPRVAGEAAPQLRPVLRSGKRLESFLDPPLRPPRGVSCVERVLPAAPSSLA